MNTNKKLDNKGFSLVELIIVIAIMAILVGVVGTQVIPYIEKSRRSKDQQLLSAYCTDTVSAASTVAAQLNSSANYCIKVAHGGTAVTVTSSPADATGCAAIQKEIEELRGGTALKWESKAAGTNGVTVYYNQNSAAGATYPDSTMNSIFKQNGCFAIIDSCSEITAVSSK